jgi:hypothetical protein
MNLIFFKKRLIKKEKAKRKKYLQEGKKLMKKKKSESTGLNHQTWDPCHESLIIKQKKFNIKKL